jgi:threonine/homoserine/homoserine lactone efflux protein
MDTSWIFAKGILIGIAVAAPVGPIGLLCIQRTLQDGLPTGLATGLGAALADGIFGAIAAFGLASISDSLIAHQDPLRIIGGLVLFVLAYRAWYRAPPEMPSAPVHVRVLSGFGTGLAVTLSNPMTIMGFIGIFAGLGLSELNAGAVSATQMVVGVLVGSGAWWLGLCMGTQALKPKFGPQSLAWTNRLAALLLIGFATFAIGGVAI